MTATSLHRAYGEAHIVVRIMTDWECRALDILASDFDAASRSADVSTNRYYNRRRRIGWFSNSTANATHICDE
jgi:hypothetical protein